MFSYVLVDDALYLHGLHDVGDELWVSVGVSDLLVQQSSDAALRAHTQTQTHTCHIFKLLQNNNLTTSDCDWTNLELGADGLRLVADVQDGNLT